jgi:hypothetical protein
MLFHKWNWDEALEVRFEEGEARGEAKVLKLMAKGYSLERIKKILRNKR